MIFLLSFYKTHHAVSLHQQQPPEQGNQGKDPFPQVRTKNTLPSHHTSAADTRESAVGSSLG